MFRLTLVNVPILIVLFSRPDSPRFFCFNSFSERGTAQNVGMTPFQSFLTSFLCYTSAGEYAGFALIAADVSLLEVAVMPLVVNVCYLLMRAAIGQRVSPGTPFIHRLCMVYDLTDEIFAVSVAGPGFLNPNYIYGVTLVAIPF
ncbi:MAG: AzlC family ABC transporter permease [Oscillospiraceae bacterium]|nr:AzlC family ABC transporter permease [Oscillospiraceae bacterium]